MVNSAGGENNLETLESTQMALERVLQQLNSQGEFSLSIFEGDNPYGFHKQILSILQLLVPKNTIIQI